jgi:hypothetical protein
MKTLKIHYSLCFTQSFKKLKWRKMKLKAFKFYEQIEVTVTNFRRH